MGSAKYKSVAIGSALMGYTSAKVVSTIDCTVQVMAVEIPSLHRVGAITEMKAFAVVEGGTVRCDRVNIRVVAAVASARMYSRMCNNSHCACL